MSSDPAAYETVTVGDKVWHLAHITDDIKSKFSAWAKLKARLSVTQCKQDLDPDAYAESLSDVGRSIAVGDYDWGSEFSKDSLGVGAKRMLASEAGAVAMIGLLLRPKHGHVLPKACAELARDAQEQILTALPVCLGMTAGGVAADRQES